MSRFCPQGGNAGVQREARNDKIAFFSPGHNPPRATIDKPTMSWPPPNYAANAAFGKGYRVTLSAFRALIASPTAQPAITALLKPWFGYDIVGRHENALVRSPEGQPVDLEALHHLIQSDPQKQFELYQAAMSLWR